MASASSSWTRGDTDGGHRSCSGSGTSFRHRSGCWPGTRPGKPAWRPAGHERVAVHVERAGLVLAFGAAECVDGLADHHVRESAVVQHFLPARTGQPAGYSTGPQVDVAQCLVWYGAAVGDVSELEPTAMAQYPTDLGEHRLLVGAQVDDPVRDHHIRATVLDRELLGEPLPELDVAEAEGLGGLACLGQHLGGHVDTDYLAAWADLAAGDEG